MAELALKDLHNPRQVCGLLVGYRSGRVKYVEADTGQAFQEYPGSWELWQILDDGRLLRVGRWLKKSIISIYAGKEG